MEGSLAIALSPSICPGVQCPFGNAAGPKSVLHALCQVVPRAMAGHKLTPSSLGLQRRDKKKSFVERKKIHS